MIQFDYNLNSSIIPRSNTLRDLENIFARKLSFVDHIIYLLLWDTGFSLRNFRNFTNLPACKSLNKSLVCSKLEYASVIWHLFYTLHRGCLEEIERFFKLLGYVLERDFSEFHSLGVLDTKVH